MFCPRCGQPAADEVRFCSRCGLPLDAAAGLLEAVGGAERTPATTEADTTLTPRQRGTRKGLMIIAGGVLFFIIVAILTTIKDDFFPFLILAGLVITAGVMRLLYGLMLEEHKPAANSPMRAAAANFRAELGPNQSRGTELPPAHTIHASFYANSAADTGNMATPPSVTENTTKLLDEER